MPTAYHFLSASSENYVTHEYISDRFVPTWRLAPAAGAYQPSGNDHAPARHLLFKMPDQITAEVCCKSIVHDTNFEIKCHGRHYKLAVAPATID